MSPEEQLEDLQRRFQLLEGERKATYETAKLNIQQNKEIIGQMKDENKMLRNQIAQLRDEKPQSLEKVLDSTSNEVQQMQRRFDMIKNENNKRRGFLDQLDIKKDELSMGSKMHSNETSPEMRQIRVLENRLDKVMIKYNEAQSIRKTYEAIVKRLKDERIGFDNQLCAIEHTLKEAVQAIKDATGVSDANEIIQKFLTQEDTQKNLQQLTKDNQSTIDRLNEDRQRLRLQVEELKFSSGGPGGRRQAIDDFESHLGEATEKFERNRGKFERVARLLIDMKAGIGHLAEKLHVVKLDETTVVPNDEKVEVEHVLEQCEFLTAPLEEVSDRQRRLDDERYEEKLMLRSQSDARIKLNVQEEEHDDDDDDLDEELDDEVSHRKQIKYNSERVEQQQQIRNKRKSKG